MVYEGSAMSSATHRAKVVVVELAGPARVITILRRQGVDDGGHQHALPTDIGAHPRLERRHRVDTGAARGIQPSFDGRHAETHRQSCARVLPGSAAQREQRCTQLTGARWRCQQGTDDTRSAAAPSDHDQEGRVDLPYKLPLTRRQARRGFNNSLQTGAMAGVPQALREGGQNSAALGHGAQRPDETQGVPQAFALLRALEAGEQIGGQGQRNRGREVRARRAPERRRRNARRPPGPPAIKRRPGNAERRAQCLQSPARQRRAQGRAKHDDGAHIYASAQIEHRARRMPEPATSTAETQPPVLDVAEPRRPTARFTREVADVQGTTTRTTGGAYLLGVISIDGEQELIEVGDEQRCVGHWIGLFDLGWLGDSPQGFAKILEGTPSPINQFDQDTPKHH